jgi:transcriptional regulator with XRE-family HTH domain
MTVGDRIKRFRKNNNIDIRKFAKEVGTSASTISRIENNVVICGYDLIGKIIEKYNIDANWLFRGDEFGYIDEEDELDCIKRLIDKIVK